MYFIFKKRKKFSSAKRIYESSFPFSDYGTEKYFNFYKDEDIGIPTKWTAPLTEQVNKFNNNIGIR